MVITFKTKTSGDVTMLDANARPILRIIGKDFAERGVITPAETGSAIQALRAAIEAEQRTRAADASVPADAPDDAQGNASRDTVPLAIRAQPLIEMLTRAGETGRDILWGV